MTLQFEWLQGAMMLWVAGGISLTLTHTHTHTFLTSVLCGEATCFFPTPPLTYISKKRPSSLIANNKKAVHVPHAIIVFVFFGVCFRPGWDGCTPTFAVVAILKKKNAASAFLLTWWFGNYTDYCSCGYEQLLNACPVPNNRKTILLVQRRRSFVAQGRNIWNPHFVRVCSVIKKNKWLLLFVCELCPAVPLCT